MGLMDASNDMRLRSALGGAKHRPGAKQPPHLEVLP
jgi:hypothetical protein